MARTLLTVLCRSEPKVFTAPPRVVVMDNGVPLLLSVADVVPEAAVTTLIARLCRMVSVPVCLICRRNRVNTTPIKCKVP